MNNARLMRYRSFLRQPLQLLRIAGFLGCIMSGVLNFGVEVYAPQMARQRNFLEIQFTGILPFWGIAILELLGYLIYGCALWRITRGEERSPQRSTLMLLGLQVVLTFCLFSFDIFYVVAAEVGLLFSLRFGVLWVIGQASIETYVYFAYPRVLTWLYPLSLLNLPRIEGIGIVAISSLLFYFTACILGRLGASEQRQRQELAAMHQMETESARLADRLAIARELHDSIGHHLTALSVHLQLANRLVTGPSAESVGEAYEVAQELLHDVRRVVGDLREVDTLQLATALKTMAANVSSPSVHVEVDPEFSGLGPVVSHALFRCAQEAITNAIRHSSARNLWISLHSTRDGYELEARDDGNGASDIHFGNGLIGIHERIENLGGRVGVTSQEGRGFDVLVKIPRKESFVA
jgi:signal transduction histidine kinase